MIPVRQSTAFETAIGPVLDSSGVAVTDCVVGDFKLKKTSGNFAALNGSATLTHVSAGFYDLVLTTSDTDTVGTCCVVIDDTTNACAPLYLQVVEEAVYDALFASTAPGYLQPTTAGRTLDVSATGEAGIDWANVGSPTTSVNLSGTTVNLVNTATTVTDQVAANVQAIDGTAVQCNGSVDFNTINTINSNLTTVDTVVDAIKVKTDYLPSATAGAAGGVFVAGSNAATTVNITGNITGNLSGSVGSVTGAVGSVTGNVGGNVVGSVASVTAAVAITSNIKKNQALAEFQFMMTDSTNHEPATGKTVTCTRSIDGAAFAAGTLANVTEVSNGMYTVDFGAGDLNGNVIVLLATATGCDDTFERIITQP